MIERLQSEFLRLTAPRMTRKQEALLARRLSLLAASHLPLREAFATLAEGERRQSVRTALADIANAIAAGSTLADACSRHEKLFSVLSVEIIRVGETTGTLSTCLDRLSRELAKQARMRSRLLGALTYPILLGTCTIAVSAGLVLFIFPKVLPIFMGLGATLPLPTRIMLALHSFLSSWGMATAALLAVGVGLAAFVHARSSRVRMWVARITLRVPLYAPIAADYRLAAFSRNLGLLIGSGVSLPDSLLGAGRALGHPLYGQAAERAALRTSSGMSTRDALAPETGFFPSLMIDLLAAGEATGALSDACLHAADYYEQEFEESSARLSALVEPALMVFMGLVVGFVAVSIILPMYALTDHLRAS